MRRSMVSSNAKLSVNGTERRSANAKKHIVLSIVILACDIMLAALQGCLRPVSVERCGYVVAIGVDEGSEKKYEFTFELQREAAGEAQATGGGAIILSCEAIDIFDAVSELASGSAYDLNFTRTHLFIFGESIAKKGEIADLLNMSFDVLRIRKSALMLVARCRVRDYIGGVAANNNANIAKVQDALISNVEMTGKTAAMNVSLFFEAIYGMRFDPVMPIGYYDAEIITDMKQNETENKGENPIGEAQGGERVGGMQALTVGCALFDGARLSAVLTGEETQFMNIVRGDYRRGTIAYSLENGETASLLAVLNKRRISVELNGERARARVLVELNITVERDPLGLINKNWRSGERERLEAFFESELEKVFLKCRDCGSDAMGFGRFASMRFRSTEQWEAFSWKKAYETLEARFEVKLNLDDEYLANRRQ